MKKILLLLFTFVLAFCSTANAVEIDPVAAIYIAETETSQIISMDLLRLTEEVTPETISWAKYNMDRAVKGELSKRKPLTVVERGDGTYEIFDGNNTFAALKVINFTMIFNFYLFKRRV